MNYSTNRDPGDETDLPEDEVTRILREAYWPYSYRPIFNGEVSVEPNFYEGDYVTHVDSWLIWKGGYARQMTLVERLLWKLGRLATVRP